MTQSDVAYIKCGSASDELKEQIKTALEDDGLEVSDMALGGLAVKQ